MSTKISATSVADSICNNLRIMTMKVTMPRFILAEFNTHRMLSKNSASSRAIPFNKMVEIVMNDPFIPIAWQKDHKGMQGTEYFSMKEAEVLNRDWLSARNEAIAKATELNALGVSKQLCNRLLEPFMWHTVLVTATEWENFFHLRCPQYVIPTDILQTKYRSRKDLTKQVTGWWTAYMEKPTELEWLAINKGQAEIHMMALAEAMWDTFQSSIPEKLNPGQWHIPFYTDEMWSKVADLDMSASFEAREKTLIQIATAKAAQTSYTVVGEDGRETPYPKLIDLHNRLLASGHMSPFEHCAQAMTKEEFISHLKGNDFSTIEIEEGRGLLETYLSTDDLRTGWCHNLRGFKSYRSMIPNEHKV